MLERNDDVQLHIPADRIIAYHPIYARAFGCPETAIFFQQAHYWWQRRGTGKQSFYHSQEEWTEETMLTRYAIERAEKKLCDLGVMDIRRGRTPAGAVQKFYRLNITETQKVIDTVSNCSKSDLPTLSESDSLTLSKSYTRDDSQETLRETRTREDEEYLAHLPASMLDGRDAYLRAYTDHLWVDGGKIAITTNTAPHLMREFRSFCANIVAAVAEVAPDRYWMDTVRAGIAARPVAVTTLYEDSGALITNAALSWLSYAAQDVEKRVDAMRAAGKRYEGREGHGRREDREAEPPVRTPPPPPSAGPQGAMFAEERAEMARLGLTYDFIPKPRNTNAKPRGFTDEEVAQLREAERIGKERLATLPVQGYTPVDGDAAAEKGAV